MDNYPTTCLDLDSNYPLVDYSTVMSVIKERTGVGGTDKNASSYIADHFIPKGWKKAQVINLSLIQSGNLGILDGVVSIDKNELYLAKDDYDPSADTCPAFGRYAFDSMMAGSTEVQQLLVGAAHKIAVVGEIANGIAQLCKEELIKHFGEVFESDFTSTFLSSKFTLAVYELYEGGTLGGLSWAAYHAIKLLYTSTTKSIGEVSIELEGDCEFKKALEEASINSEHLSAYLQVTECVRFAQDLSKAKNLVVESQLDAEQGSFFIFENSDVSVVSANLSGARFIHYISYLLYLLCGGKFAPEYIHEEGKTKVNGHAALALIAYTCPSGLWAKMKANSVAIANLDLFLEECLPVINSDLCYEYGDHEFEKVNGEQKPILKINTLNF